MKTVGLINLAEANLGKGNLEQAKEIFYESINLSRKDNLQKYLCEALIALAKLESQLNNIKAKELSSEAVEIAQRLNNQSLIKQATAIDISLSGKSPKTNNRTSIPCDS